MCKRKRIVLYTLKRDRSIFYDQVHQPLGDDGGIAEIYKWEVAEEKLHGGVQFRVTSDYDHHPNISYHNHTVDEQRSHEEWNLDFGIIWEAQEDEGDPTFISIW